MDFGPPQPGDFSPVPLARLGSLLASHRTEMLRFIDQMDEIARIRLASWAFTRGLPDVAAAVAERCDASRLVELAGPVGHVLAARVHRA